MDDGVGAGTVAAQMLRHLTEVRNSQSVELWNNERSESIAPDSIEFSLACARTECPARREESAEIEQDRWPDASPWEVDQTGYEAIQLWGTGRATLCKQRKIDVAARVIQMHDSESAHQSERHIE